MIWTKTWRILELLDLSKDFAKIAHAPPDGSMGSYFLVAFLPCLAVILRVLCRRWLRLS